jgi:hypothetical protein
MKYYIHPNLVANYSKMVEFRRALNPGIFNEQDLMYIDRTGIFGNDTDIIVLQPLNDFDKTKTYDFNQLVETRAKELISLSKQRNEPLQLMWSGGIDSTSIYCALMTYLENPQDLIILGNKNSVVEYPDLYNKIIQKHKFVDLGIVNIGINLNNLFTDTSIIISGELTDQLFMAQIIGKLPETVIDWDVDPWQLLLNPNMQQYHSTVEYFVNNYPTTIITVKQFLKAVRFNFKYQRVQLRICNSVTNAVLNKNLFNFYDTKEFNFYALGANIEQLGEHDLSSPNNKIPLKKLILDYTQDQDYYDNKTKYASRVKYESSQITNTIDENWNKSFTPSNYIDQPGITKNNKYSSFSSNIGLVDWKIYQFNGAKKSNILDKTTVLYNKYICICGFKENASKTSENFFAFFGDFVKYEILPEVTSVIRFDSFGQILTRKLIDNIFTEPYPTEIDDELIIKFNLIDYDSYEVIDPKTF